MDLLLRKQVLCRECGGSGAHSPQDVQRCNHCGGSGTKVVRQQIAPGFVQQMQTPCQQCNGKGKIVTRKCLKCRGEDPDKREGKYTFFYTFFLTRERLRFKALSWQSGPFLSLKVMCFGPYRGEGIERQRDCDCRCGEGRCRWAHDQDREGRGPEPRLHGGRPPAQSRH